MRYYTDPEFDMEMTGNKSPTTDNKLPTAGNELSTADNEPRTPHYNAQLRAEVRA